MAKRSKISAGQKFTVGPLTFSESEWNELFHHALKSHMDSNIPAPIAWIEQFLELAKREGFELRLNDNLKLARSLWRN